MPTFNSILPYVGDGVQTRWNINFPGGYISPSHVFVVVDDVATPALFEGASTVVVEPAIAAGVSFTIERRTPNSVPLVDYRNGADFSEENLDTTSRQAVFVASEAADRTASDAGRAIRAPVGEALAALPLAADRKGKLMRFHPDTGDVDPKTAAELGLELALTNAALAYKSDQDRSRANHTGTQAIATVAGLQAGLDAKAALADLASGDADKGASLIGWLRASAGAVAAKVSDFLRPRLSVLEFIPRNLHEGIRDGTNTTDLTPYIEAGLAARASASGGLVVDWPDGFYRISTLRLRGINDLYFRAVGTVNIIGIGGTFLIGDDLFDEQGHQETFTRRFRMGGGAGRFVLGRAAGATYTKAGILLQNFVDFALRDVGVSGIWGDGTGDRVAIDAELSFCGVIENCDVGYPGAPPAGFKTYGIRTGSDNINVFVIRSNRLVGGTAAVADVVGIKAEGSALTVANNDVSAFHTAIQVHAGRGAVLDNNYCESVAVGIETTFLTHGLVIKGGYYDILTDGTALKLGLTYNATVVGGYYRFTGANTTFLDRGSGCYGLNISGFSIKGDSPPTYMEVGTFRPDGGLTGFGYQALSTGAITFPATHVPRADPNTLDDYEEGTWTPVYRDATLLGPGGAGSPIATYTKVGNNVTLRLWFSLGSETMSSVREISGLPIPPAASKEHGVSIGYQKNPNLYTFRLDESGGDGYLYPVNPTDGADRTPNQLSNTEFSLVVHYKAAA